MPTQVQNRRPSSAEPLPPRTSIDKDRHMSMPPQDPMNHPSHDPRAKFNQHREALRLALGSILTPKRPPMPGSRSSSGTASPAYSFSGSSGTYTPATPPSLPQTPSLDVNSQDHPYSRMHHPHFYPTHPPSKLGRMESYHDTPEGDISASTMQPLASSPPKQPTTPFGHHQQPHPSLVRSRSQNPSPRTSPRIQPTTPPMAHSHPAAFTTADCQDIGPPFSSSPSPPSSSPSSPIPMTNHRHHHDDGGRIAGGQMMSTSGDSSGSAATGAQGVPMDSPGQQNECGSSGNGGESQGMGGGPPRAKFIQTLKGKSAWDALIHGSFS